MAQSSLSNQAVNQYIEISTHLINMQEKIFLQLKTITKI